MTNLLLRITTAMEYDRNIDGATFSTCVSPDVLLKLKRRTPRLIFLLLNMLQIFVKTMRCS